MDKSAIKVAVEALIKTKRYIEQKKYVLDTVESWSKRQIRFVGDDEPLNAMVDLGLESREALANVFALIERKRRAIPTAKKMDYQRDYMRQRRHRLMSAIKIEQIITGKKMTAEEKAAFSAALLADWTKQREAELAKYPEADWKERNVIVGHFWEAIDNRLNAELAKANSVLDTPTHRKVRKVQVRKPVGILGEKLQSALDRRTR
jgi:hypothetical protein